MMVVSVYKVSGFAVLSCPVLYLQVGDQQINLTEVLLESFQALVVVLRRDHGVLVGCQEARRDLEDGRGVVGEQDTQGRQRRLVVYVCQYKSCSAIVRDCISGSRRSHRSRCLFEVWAVGEGEPEDGPLLAVVPVAHPAQSAEGFDALGQGVQAETGAARGALRLL